MKTITLSGWGQPYDALSAIAPNATHIDFAHHKNLADALADIAAQARDADMVIGWSLGGQLAVRAIAAEMFRPKQLVLIATPYQFVTTQKNLLGMKRDLYDKFRDNVARNPERALGKAWELIHKGDNRAAQVRAHLDKRDKKKTLEKDWLHWLDMLDGFSFDESKLAGFPLTLLIHGDQDVVVEHEQSRHFSHAIPYAKLITVKGAGHAPHWHDVEMVKNMIKELPMFDTHAVKEAFGRAAPVYDAHAHLQRQVRQHCLALGQSYWPSGKHILDAGCGTGALLQETSRLRLRWRVTSLDLSLGMCSVAKEKSGAVVNADASAMPFADNSFDGLFSSLMLQWANNPQVVWYEMARVLKPQGRIILSTFVQGTLQELREAFSSLDGKPHVSHFMQTHEILKSAADAGLTMSMAEQARIVNHYPDAIALMRSLQFIGATHKGAGRGKGLMTLKQLAGVERVYEKRFGVEQGLPATWQLLCLVLQKA